MARNNPTAAPESESDAEERRWHLGEEIDKNLTQAKGICDAIIHLQDIDGLIADSLWAASDLIAGAKKAFKELRGIPYHGPPAPPP